MKTSLQPSPARSDCSFVQSSRLNEMFEPNRLDREIEMVHKLHRDGVKEKRMVQSGRLNQQKL